VPPAPPESIPEPVSHAPLVRAGVVVRTVWERLLEPGLREHFDAPRSLAAIAPRPCLVVNNAADPRCPRAGVELACCEAWRAAPQHSLGLLLDTSVAAHPLPPEDWAAGHTITPTMQRAVDEMLRHCVLEGQDELPPSLASLGGVVYATAPAG
jgi:hypothetical protein